MGMGDGDPLPTFRSNKDRIVVLLIEWKWPLLVTFLAAGTWVAYARPELPEPPGWMLAASAAAFILTLPLYFFFRRLAEWLDPGPEWVYVGVADPGTADSETDQTGRYDMKKVRPEVWAGRTETKHSALRPAAGRADFVVSRFNWMEEIEELEVQGPEAGDLPPAEAWDSATKVDTVYDHHMTIKRKYSMLKAKVSDFATDVHDSALMAEVAEREKANLAPGVSVADRIEEMENEVDGLPDGPAEPTETVADVEDALDQLRIDDIDDLEGVGVDPSGGHGQPPRAATDGGEHE